MKRKLWTDNDLRTVLLSALFGSLCMIALSALMAGVILGGIIEQTQTDLLALLICFTGVLLASVLAAKHVKKRKFLASLAAAGTMNALLTLLRLIFWSKEPATVLPQLCCIAAAAIIGGFLGSQKKKRSHRRRR